MENTTDDLSRKIERLVQEHVAAIRVETELAVARAFANSAGAPTPRKPATRKRTIGKRRTPTEMTALCDELYKHVCAKPGQMMTSLAPMMKSKPRELQRPMAVLKKAGKVRSVGQRHVTQYFPLVADGETETAKSA